jgi:hypothetical protein
MSELKKNLVFYATVGAVVILLLLYVGFAQWSAIVPAQQREETLKELRRCIP